MSSRRAAAVMPLKKSPIPAAPPTRRRPGLLHQAEAERAAPAARSAAGQDRRLEQPQDLIAGKVEEQIRGVVGGILRTRQDRADQIDELALRLRAALEVGYQLLGLLEHRLVRLIEGSLQVVQLPLHGPVADAAAQAAPPPRLAPPPGIRSSSANLLDGHSTPSAAIRRPASRGRPPGIEGPANLPEERAIEASRLADVVVPAVRDGEQLADGAAADGIEHGLRLAAVERLALLGELHLEVRKTRKLSHDAHLAWIGYTDWIARMRSTRPQPWK